ncbi:general stress protein (plasmid) [Coraliomargarita sp. W4R53]
MTMIGGRIPQGVDDVGQTLTIFPTYERAQKAVSILIAAEVPARDIAIVGQGLRSVERVTGRLGYATAARSGAINGVLLGLLFSAILVIGDSSVPIPAFIGVLFVGIAIGMLLSLVTFAFVRRRRPFASVTAVVAETYEVTVAAASYTKARQALAGGVAATAAQAAGAAPGDKSAKAEKPVKVAKAEKPVKPAKAAKVAKTAKGSEPAPVEPTRPPAHRVTPGPEAPPRYGQRIAVPAAADSDKSDAPASANAPASSTNTDNTSNSEAERGADDS